MFRRKALLVLIANVTRSTSGILVALLLTRVMEQAGYGQFRGAQLIATFVVSVAVGGLPASLLYLCSTSTGAVRRRLVIVSLVQLVSFGGIGFVLFRTLGSEIAAAVTSIDDPTLVGAAGWLVLGQVLSLSASTAWLATARLGPAALNDASIGVGNIAVCALVAFASGDPRDVLVALGVFNLLLGALSWGALVLSVATPDSTTESLRALLRRQWTLALPQTVNGLLGPVVGHVDKLIVASWFGAERFATYACGAIEVPIVTLVPHALTRIIAPRLAERHSAGHVREFLELWHRSVRYTALIVYPCAILLLLGADDLIGLLFPPAYAAAATPLRIFALALFFRVTSYGMVLQSTGTTMPILPAATAGIVANLLAALVLVPRVGPNGAAWGALFGQFVSFAVHVMAIRRRLQRGYREIIPVRLMMKLAVVTIAAGSSSLMLGRLTGAVGGSALAYVAAVVVFVGLATALRLLRIDDLRLG